MEEEGRGEMEDEEALEHRRRGGGGGAWKEMIFCRSNIISGSKVFLKYLNTQPSATFKWAGYMPSKKFHIWKCDSKSQQMETEHTQLGKRGAGDWSNTHIYCA